MARQLRIEYEGAFYHITSRGNRREEIFWDDEDREKLKSILERTKERYGYLLHAYVFMKNHYHLLVETPNANLHQIMQNVNTSYAVLINRKYERVGHLFQGRYKAFVVDKERYLLELGRYIHLNPVRVGVVKRPEQYRWSSYRDYIYGPRDERLVETEETLNYFSTKPDVAARRYKEFVHDGIHANSPLKDATDSILGEETFREKIFKSLRILPDRREVPDVSRKAKSYEIRDVVRGVAGYFGLEKGDDLLHRRKRTEKQRRLAIYLCKVLSGKKNVEIGRVFGISTQGVTNAVRRVEQMKEMDKGVNAEIMRIMEAVIQER